MINQLSDKLRKKMEETILSLKRDMDSISTGRANPNLLDTIRVEVYGSMMPITNWLIFLFLKPISYQFKFGIRKA